MLELLFDLNSDPDFRPEFGEEVPGAVFDRLMLPSCIQAYDPNGLARDQFSTLPSTASRVEAFSKGFVGLETFISKRLAVRQH